MATDLHVVGPYKVEYTKTAGVRRVSASHGRAFWKRIEHLRLKRGCYIFATRAGKGFMPWYVGKAGAKKGFEQETFTKHKLGRYNDALAQRSRGTPVLFFVTPVGTKRMVPAKELNHMERELIQFALAKNPDLQNVQHTKNVPRWSIRGVTRSPRGKPSTTSKSFKLMMKM